MAAESAFLQKLGNDFLRCRSQKPDLTAAKAVFFVHEKLLQRNHLIRSGEIGGYMVGIGDADIGRGIGGNIGDHVIVYSAIIRIQPQVHSHIGIEGLEILDGLLIDSGLGLVGVVLGPKGDLIILLRIKFIGNLERIHASGTVTACKQKDGAHKKRCKTRLYRTQMRLAFLVYVFHPLVPPLDTPAMTLLRKIKNSKINGTEITTTAAIIAGMISRPKPFSRIS